MNTLTRVGLKVLHFWIWFYALTMPLAILGILSGHLAGLVLFIVSGFSIYLLRRYAKFKQDRYNLRGYGHR
jgi:membrane protein implicated in regulation of membrane protease activity